jgi:hypothetical protein
MFPLIQLRNAYNLISNFLLLIRRGLWIYFWTIQVLFLLAVDSTMMFLISSNSLETVIPLPLFVFSPGLTIQIFLLKEPSGWLLALSVADCF